MGKKAKEHRAKVAKRNANLKQKKSAMQKAFDMLIQQQIESMKNAENLKVEGGAQDYNFEIVEDRKIDHAFNFIPNDEESAKINKQFEEEQPVEEQISELEK